MEAPLVFPEGFPTKMLLYNWFRRTANWHPREVDELYLDELEWFPIVEEAIQDAVDRISKENNAQK